MSHDLKFCMKMKIAKNQFDLRVIGVGHLKYHQQFSTYFYR